MSKKEEKNDVREVSVSAADQSGQGAVPVVEASQAVIRHPYRGPRNRVTKVFTQDSLTKQYFKDECDINNVVQKFLKTGEMPEARVQPRYGDVSEVPDFREALDIVREGREEFAELPARVRAYFENDPAQFLDAVKDPSRVHELEDLGIVTRREPEPPKEAAPGTDPQDPPPEPPTADNGS